MYVINIYILYIYIYVYILYYNYNYIYTIYRYSKCSIGAGSSPYFYCNAVTLSFICALPIGRRALCR